MNPLRISVITPSFNQAQFLPAALASVAAQRRRPIEHLVYDPGSTDGSRDIAAAAPGVTLIAEPDNGQADAVARGMSEARGDIIAWLNSDDEYYDPGVFEAVAAAFAAEDTPDIVFGDGDYVGADGEFLRAAYVTDSVENLPTRLAAEVGILQPAAFISRRLIERIGAVDPDLNFCMDYEFWIRAAQAGARFKRLGAKLAKARYYADNKTFGQRDDSFAEIIGMLKRKYGFAHYRWIRRYADYREHNRDGVLSHFGEREANTEGLDAATARLARLVNGDFATVSFLRETRNPQLTGRTFRALAGAGEPVADQYASPAPPGDEPVRGARCYTVGDQRWAFERNWLDDALARSAGEIKHLAESRRGDVCVLAGNGPTLNRVDMSLLQDTDVFITNYAFRKNALRAVARYLCVTNYLVAEQEAAAFNLVEDMVKIAPYWLSYCLLPTVNTCYVRSVGHAAFSTDFTENVSWRSTVSFFAMQMAYALGYRKVLLVGFDHNYQQPKSVEGDLVKQDTDDPNHFDPRYFKGKVWQAADTDNMEAMYRLAKAAFESDGREIVNCTDGGRLELFRRGDLAAELGGPREDLLGSESGQSGGNDDPHRADQTPPATSTKSLDENQVLADFAEAAPRVLLIDHTRIGDGSATGEVKANIFDGWPEERIAQLYIAPHLRCGYICNGEETRFTLTSDGRAPREIADAIAAFDPQLILYRPVPLASASSLHFLAMQLISTLDAPHAIWIMDDWPALISPENASAYERCLLADLRTLIDTSALRMSIGTHMSDAFASRYGADFLPFANGVDPAEWPIAAPRREHTLKVRYAGSLAENMTLESVLRIAEAVEALAGEGVDIKFQINTRKLWRERAGRLFNRFKHTTFLRRRLDANQYRAWLCEADFVVIAYNFDPTSIDYVRYSVANKLPECLASGAVLFAHGPRAVATMRYLNEADVGVRIETPETKAVLAALRDLAKSPDRRLSLTQHAQALAASRHDIGDIRRRFRTVMVRAASAPAPTDMGAPRCRRVHVDETNVIANLLADAPRGSVMIDVGAHHGSSLEPFHKLGWTVHAFEPDPKNRRRLEELWGGVDGVIIDPRALSDHEAEEVSFYASTESSGISGLSAFRETHRETTRVSVTTLASVLKEGDIETVDFLKIDAEGFDLSVLRGVPWDSIAPSVVECEFEDAKTIPLGHDWRAICEYLCERGYSVYVSEWHPIERYGVRHAWRRVVSWPDAVLPGDAWGNILAFREDPGLENVRTAFEAELKEDPLMPEAAPPAQPPARHAGAPGGPANVADQVAESLSDRAPGVYARLRLPWRAAQAAWRRKRTLAPAALLLLAWIGAGFVGPLADYRILVWGSAALLLTLGATAYLFLHTRRLIQLLAAENVRLRKTTGDAEKRLAAIEKEAAQLRDRLDDHESRTAIAPPFRAERSRFTQN